MRKTTRYDLLWRVVSFPLKALKSVKLAIVALVLLAAASIAGTLIVQGASQQTYESLYGQWAWRVFSATGLTNIFGSWWFLGLIGWLTAGMLVCSVVRLPKIVRTAMRRDIPREPSQYKQAQHYKSFACPERPDSSPERLADKAAAILRSSRYRIVARLNEQKASYLLASKGMLGKFGPFLVHLSVIVIVAGGSWTALGRFSQEVTVQVGDEAPLVGTPYSIRLNDFIIKRYPGTDLPQEYISRISLSRDGRAIGGGQLKVNSPLSIGGFNFYQWKYFPTVRDVTVAVTRTADGTAVGEFKLPMNQKVRVDEIGLTLNAGQFLPDFALTADKVAVSRSPEFSNPAVQMETYSDGELLGSSWVFPDLPGFHAANSGDYTYRLADYTRSSASGLKVVRDPAVPLVYAGFIMLMLGALVSCYIFHRRTWVMVHRCDDGIVLHLAGQCDRNVLDFRTELDKCFSRILAEAAGEEQ